MITPQDLANDERKSGYNYVNNNGPTSYRAAVGTKPKYPGHPGKNLWRGPTRKTAHAAAQDYCDRVNGSQQQAPRQQLRSANHPRTPRATVKAKTSASERKLKAARKQVRELEAVVRKESEGSEGFVYLIGETTHDGRPGTYMNGVWFDSGGVKVGFAERSPQQRLRDGQTFNRRKLVLIGYIRGTREDEAALHQEFIHHNILGEWFHPTPALLSRFTNQGGSS